MPVLNEKKLLHVVKSATSGARYWQGEEFTNIVPVPKMPRN